MNKQPMEGSVRSSGWQPYKGKQYVINKGHQKARIGNGLGECDQSDNYAFPRIEDGKRGA